MSELREIQEEIDTILDKMEEIVTVLSTISNNISSSISSANEQELSRLGFGKEYQEIKKLQKDNFNKLAKKYRYVILGPLRRNEKTKTGDEWKNNRKKPQKP